MLRIDVRSSRELRAAVLAIREASREVARQYRQELKRVADPAWRESLRGNVHTRLQTRVLADTGRVAVSSQNVRLSSATVGRALSKRTGGAGAAKPADIARLVEFGGAPGKYSTYQRRSAGGGRHTVRRRTMTGYGPQARGGNVVYPALADMVPRVAALLVQTCVRTLNDAFDRKG
jgi:hypothetical protein